MDLVIEGRFFINGELKDTAVGIEDGKMTVITLYWKISIHAVGVIGPTMALSYAFWPWGLLFILVLPPIVWSRYVLKKHTPAQLVAGALVGFVITGTVFLLLL